MNKNVVRIRLIDYSDVRVANVIVTEDYQEALYVYGETSKHYFMKNDLNELCFDKVEVMLLKEVDYMRRLETVKTCSIIKGEKNV